LIIGYKETSYLIVSGEVTLPMAGILYRAGPFVKSGDPNRAALAAANDKHSLSADEQDLQRLGYAQQLLRDFGGFSNFAVSFSIISILTGAVTLFDYGLAMGGPREMLLGWPLVTLGTLAVTLSMAELCSALPTSGGMYHWSAELGGPTWAWFTAWLNIVGLITAIAGIDYGCAEFLVPMLGLHSKPHSLLAVYAVLLLSQTVINHYSSALISWLSSVSVVVHILGVAVLIGSLFIFAPRQPAAFLWSTRNLSSVHAPYAWLFLLGLLQAQWTYTGFDASAHMAEETVDPRRHAPWGMVMSVLISGVFGYVLILALVLAIPDVAQVLQTRDASGNLLPAVLTIVRLTLGGRAATAVLALTVLAMWFCGLTAITSVSRSFFALARDGGIPVSAIWSRVHSKLKTPVPAVWLSAALAFAAMLYSGAYSVVTSISVIGFYLAYIAPVYLGWRKKKTWVTKRGPWHLGDASDAVNLLAVLWTAFICTMMVMPPNTRAGWGIVSVLGVLFLLHVASGKHKIYKPNWEYARSSDANLE
jgi:amino acid transporter